MGSYKTIINKNLFFIALFLGLLPFSLAVEITEIMYDPEGSDGGYEWIEIYSEEPINISGWKFLEAGTNHGLTLIDGDWEIENYAVITEDGQKFKEAYPDYDGTLLDSYFSLRNDGEYLALKDNLGNLAEEINYSFPYLGGSKGHSLEKIELGGRLPTANQEANWGFGLIKEGTPGKQNSLINSCDWEISLDSNTWWELENGTTSVKWKINLFNPKNSGQANFSYWVEDVSGKVIKSPIDKITNTSETFGPYTKTLHSPGGYILLANITSTSCFDYKRENNWFRQPIVVVGIGQPEDLPSSSIDVNSSINLSESSIEISEISPNKTQFGDNIKVELEIYRGDTSKYALSLQLEDETGKSVGDKSTIHVKDKYTSYRFAIPIYLPEECKYKKGKYSLILEGLGLKEAKEIEIEGLECLTEETNNEGNNDNNDKSSKKRNQRFAYSMISFPKEVYLGEELRVGLELKNDEEDKDYFVSAYLYNGKKCYSCKDSTLERDNNQIKVKLKEYEEKTLEIPLLVDSNINEGKYKLKAVILEEGLKTPKELTEEILVIKNKEKEAKATDKPELTFSEAYSQSPSFIAHKVVEASPGIVIFESNSYKSKRLIPFILGLSLLILIILLARKN